MKTLERCSEVYFIVKAIKWIWYLIGLERLADLNFFFFFGISASWAHLIDGIHETGGLDFHVVIGFSFFFFFFVLIQYIIHHICTAEF
jgi:hypothetical protein